MATVTQEEVVLIIKGTGLKVDWDKLDFEESLTDQGADSLDMISIIFALTEKYDIEITDDSISNGDWLSVAKMVMNLNKLLQEK
jgi:acyl carrier protein